MKRRHAVQMHHAEIWGTPRRGRFQDEVETEVGCGSEPECPTYEISYGRRSTMGVVNSDSLGLQCYFNVPQLLQVQGV
jgi:hypothetical protein